MLEELVHLEERTFYWWIDHSSAIASLPLALVGFGITIWQLLKTRTAAESAHAAAIKAMAQVSRMTLIGLLPQLRQIDDEMDRAIKEKATEPLRFWISQWKFQASQVRGHLAEHDREEAKLMRAIQASLSAASDLRQALHGMPADQLPATSQDLMKNVNKITAELGTLAARKSVETEGSNQ